MREIFDGRTPVHIGVGLRFSSSRRTVKIAKQVPFQQGLSMGLPNGGFRVLGTPEHPWGELSRASGKAYPGFPVGMASRSRLACPFPSSTWLVSQQKYGGAHGLNRFVFQKISDPDRRWISNCVDAFPFGLWRRRECSRSRRQCSRRRHDQPDLEYTSADSLRLSIDHASLASLAIQDACDAGVGDGQDVLRESEGQ